MNSAKEKQVLSHIKGIAVSCGLTFRQDRAGNLLVCKPGSGKGSGAPPLMIQGHVDMVCEKNSTSKFNFDTDPIKLVLDGDWLTADGTTLGADNGVGVAMALAIMEMKATDMPPLEFLFTVEEETGLVGAHALDPKALGCALFMIFFVSK